MDAARRRGFLAFLLLGLLIGATYLLRNVFLFVFLGIMAAVLSRPLHTRLSGRLSPVPAGLLTLAVTFLAVALPVAGLIAWASEDAADLAGAVADGTASDAVAKVVAAVAGWTGIDAGPDAAQRATTWVEAQGASIVTRMVESLDAAKGRLVIGTTVFMFVAYYALKDGKRFVDWTRLAMPLPAHQSEALFDAAHRAMHGVFRGQVLTALAKGAVGAVGLWIVDVPGVILLGLVMALFTLLPIFTAYMVWLPAAVWLLAEGQIWQGLFLLFWGSVITGNTDNLLRPKLIGLQTKIHPVFVLLGVVAGITAFGFLGVFVGPVLVAIGQAVAKVWVEETRGPDALPPEPVRAPPARLASLAAVFRLR